LADNDGAYELALEITVGEAEIMGFNLFNDKGEKVDIYFNLPEKRLVMDRTKSGIVDFGKKSVSHEIEVHDRRKTTSINYIDDFALATWAPIKKENKYTLDVFVDKCSVEIFLNGGKVAMTNLIFPSEPYNRMCFYSKGGSFQVDSFKAYRLGL
jgi:beta-fructosidases (levanase/invertase)